jgi:hypothetical protein
MSSSAFYWQQPGAHPQQRCFASTIRTLQQHDFSALHRKINASQCRKPTKNSNNT